MSDITIKPLTTELIPDFFDFFNNRAFRRRNRLNCSIGPKNWEAEMKTLCGHFAKLS